MLLSVVCMKLRHLRKGTKTCFINHVNQIYPMMLLLPIRTNLNTFKKGGTNIARGEALETNGVVYVLCGMIWQRELSKKSVPMLYYCESIIGHFIS